MGASSFSPSPMTTTPSIDTVSSSSRMASTAAPSAPSLSPRPTQRAQASAAYSVVRTSSSARLRSGRWPRSDAASAVVVTGAALQDAGRFTGVGVRGLAEVPGYEHGCAGQEPDEVAVAERDLAVGLARLAEDDPVAEDQHEGGDAHHH